MSRRKTTWIRTETITVTTVKMKAASDDHDDEDEGDRSLPLHLVRQGSDDTAAEATDSACDDLQPAPPG
jgi:hypothetical protein